MESMPLVFITTLNIYHTTVKKVGIHPNWEEPKSLVEFESGPLSIIFDKKLGKWVNILIKVATMESLTREDVYLYDIKLDRRVSLSCAWQSLCHVPLKAAPDLVRFQQRGGPFPAP